MDAGEDEPTGIDELCERRKKVLHELSKTLSGDRTSDGRISTA
jgi:hypothetical protein